jgi:YkoY family integral membrane protein
MNLIYTFFNELGHLGLPDIGIIFAILIMDAALSGDNSIAINALAMDLPEKLRNKTIWIGMVLAGILRLVALGFATFIITNPWVQILGGLYLIKLCIDHFRKEKNDEESGRKSRKSFIAVLVAIGFLDLSLSLDNVIAVVALSQNFAVIVIGVLASIAMLAVATQLVRKIMRRYPSLEPAAYIILAFLGVIMIAEHGAEFVIWTGGLMNKLGIFISNYHDSIIKFSFKLGNVEEIIFVAAIIITAIVIEEIDKKRKRVKHHKKNSDVSETE